MHPERWHRIEELYHRAMARPTDERAEFLHQECGDDEALRLEVESLVSQEVGQEQFLAEPALLVGARLVTDGATLLTGRQLGPYQIAELLGAGGMGDVYRARDTTLHRDVAIKFLPMAFTSDAIRLARFETEARTLASLNHPHIGAIYGLVDDDGLPALVLELVDGETLAERVARGRLAPDESFRIARQIAEALDAAHQRSIVHRDLKPANIKITPEGIVKVLDFGLATATSAEDAGADAPHERLLGTPAYMSPEQARGGPVDKRTDIWGFGCLLFEMLTGRPAFRAKTIPDTIASVRDHEPDWTALPDGVPQAARSLLQRCLEKDPKRRRRDIGDVLIDLEELTKPSDAGSPASRSSGRTARWAALAVIGILVGVVTWLWTRPSPDPALSYSSVFLPGETEPPLGGNQVAVSPDGRTIVYTSGGNASRHLALRRLDSPGTRVLSGTADAQTPFFSSDGRWVGFFDVVRRKLKKKSLDDGRVEVICDTPDGASGGWWGNGFILFGATPDLAKSGISRVSENGGPLEALSHPNRADGQLNHMSPQMLPDGRTLMYTVRSTGPGGFRNQIVVQQGNSSPRVLVEGAIAGRYLGNGRLVYQSGSSLFVTKLDPNTLEILGRPTALLGDLGIAGRPVWATTTDVLVYWPDHDDRQFVWVSREGVESPPFGKPKAYRAPMLSPFGDRIAVQITDGDASDIWLFDIRRDNLTRLTVGGASAYPMWSHDGTRVGFLRRPNDIYWQFADREGSEAILRAEYPTWIGSWTRDMRTLVYMQVHPTTNSDLWAIDLQGDRRPRPVVRTPAREYGGRVSPDGRWLAYFSDVTGRQELYVTRFPEGDQRWPISSSGAREAVWSHNGRELFYRSGEQMVSVSVPDAKVFSPGKTQLLFTGPYFHTGGSGIVNYDVSPDGQRFLMLKAVGDVTPRLSVVQGFNRLMGERLQAAQ